MCIRDSGVSGGGAQSRELGARHRCRRCHDRSVDALAGPIDPPVHRMPWGGAGGSPSKVERCTLEAWGWTSKGERRNSKVERGTREVRRCAWDEGSADLGGSRVNRRVGREDAGGPGLNLREGPADLDEHPSPGIHATHPFGGGLCDTPHPRDASGSKRTRPMRLGVALRIVTRWSSRTWTLPSGGTKPSTSSR